MPNGMNVIRWAIEVMITLRSMQMAIEDLEPEALHLMFVRGYTPHQAATRIINLRARGENLVAANIPSMMEVNHVKPVPAKK